MTNGFLNYISSQVIIPRSSSALACQCVCMIGSGVGYGGPSYHLGSGDGLEILNYRDRHRSGSDGDGEDDSPPTQRHGLPMIPQSVQNIPPHLNCQSLRRSRSRPSPSSSALGVTGGHYQTPGGISSKSLIQENPYQQPYLGRSAGLSDSPTSDNASDATLTDSELPISNQNALPLQNGGLLMGGNLDFSTASGKLNSLKRNINSNGKSTTGIGLVNHTHSGNHDNLIDQFVMHTSGGKIYIPQDTPKNSTSDYKTSPSSSPTKKISGSLLYKDATNMGTLRDGRSISKSDDDDFMYKVKRFCCTCNKSLAIVLIFLLCLSFVVNILFVIGAIQMESDSAKCVQAGDRIDDNRDLRQSSATIGNGTYGRRLDKSTSSAGDVELAVDEKSLEGGSTNLHVASTTSAGSGGRNRLRRNVMAVVKNDGGSRAETEDLHLHAAQTGVNEMVTTSTEPITEGIEEVEEYSEQNSPDSYHTLSRGQNGRDFHKISETGGMDLRRTVVNDADDDAKPTLSISKTNPRPEEEMADDSTRRNIFDHLIEVVSQEREPEQNTSSTEPVMNVEETARKSWMRTGSRASGNTPQVVGAKSQTEHFGSDGQSPEQTTTLYTEAHITRVGVLDTELSSPQPEEETVVGTSISNMTVVRTVTSEDYNVLSLTPPPPPPPHSIDPIDEVDERLMNVEMSSTEEPTAGDVHELTQADDSLVERPFVQENSNNPSKQVYSYSYEPRRPSSHQQRQEDMIVQRKFTVVSTNNNNNNPPQAPTSNQKNFRELNYQQVLDEGTPFSFVPTTVLGKTIPGLVFPGSRTSLNHRIIEPAREIIKDRKNSESQRETPTDSSLSLPVNNYAAAGENPADSDSARNKGKAEDSQPRISISYDHPQLLTGRKEEETPVEIVSIQLDHHMGYDGPHSQPTHVSSAGGKVFSTDELQLSGSEYDENNVIKAQLEKNEYIHHARPASSSDSNTSPSLLENNQIDDDGLHSRLRQTPDSFHQQHAAQGHLRRDDGGNPQDFSPQYFQHYFHFPARNLSNSNHTNNKPFRGNHTNNNVLSISASTELAPQPPFIAPVSQANLLSHTTPLPTTSIISSITTTTSTTSTEASWGGVCECFCPCMDDYSSREDYGGESSSLMPSVDTPLAGTSDFPQKYVSEGSGSEERPEDEEFIVISTTEGKGLDDNKSNFEQVTDEWLEFSGSGSGLGAGQNDESFTIPVSDSNSNALRTEENQYYSSLTGETITMQYEWQDNNSVSEDIPSPGLDTTAATEKPIVSHSSSLPNMVDEFTPSSSDSSLYNLPNEDEEEEGYEDYDDDNETMRPIVQVSTMAEMRSTQGADYNRENSLAGTPNGIRRGEETSTTTTTTEEPDEIFQWVQCSCSQPVGKNYYEKEKMDPGARTYPAVNFPPDGTSFAQITLGSRLSNIIGSYSYWNMQFYQSEGAYVTWEMSVPRGASVGFYARRNALPTHTHYDFMEILRGFKTRSKRSSPPTVTKELSKFIEQGHWFLSLYNDDSDPQEVIFASTISEEMTEGCPNGCSGNGQCQMGHCQCNGGFGGEDCSQSICPVLCTGRGEYLNGECQCNPGWKGKECNLRHDECEIPDCNGHGKCVNGKCSCIRGYKGEFCQETDCMHPTCSGHGFCLAGTCMCKKGWRGADCSQPDNEALQCLPDCSSHGVFNLETQTCSCEPRWTGEDCSQELCDTNCGAHGICIGGGCQCSEGWTGPLCNQRVCDKRCGDHGQCKNGTCLCVTGWNGRHCTLEGCPNSCSGHGQCKANYEGLWECKCHAGWTGIECSVMMEQNCNDGKDNDKDGLTDCEDPECCSVTQCEKSQLCVSARKPIDILLRKQPPAITASFFEKMKFLIEEGSLQSYARQDAFNGSRSGVVRGRVVTPNGSGLMGVRVSSSSPLEPLGGFTLTQDDGWFDLMVNGGGAVTLHFGRSPFNPQTRTIFVPWNEVVIIDIVVMGSLDVDDRVFVRGQSCDSHDYDTMKPIVLATWKHGFQGDCPETSTILVESQVVQESVRIPGSGIHLMYHSSRVQGYLSTIQLQLTAETIPPSLKRVHLRITIEGVLFEKIFEADPDIKFTYAWNRLNVYRQRVYGVTTAIVKVGYEYNNCASIIWDVQSTTLSGHDMSISDIGGWNLDIHHRYNFHEGIIQKGDGSNIYLKHRPRVIITAMGNGYQRSLDCLSECNGIAAKQRLLAPVALQAAPDGTVFVGDFDLIRRIMVDGTVHNVVKLNATRVSYRYHMALSPVDNMLYISDPESHQIIRVRNIEDSSDPEHNWEPVVGSGERCLPGDEAHCGDEALARDAKLAYPKGVAVSSDNVLYFADGTNIRKVDRDGIITTVIGNHQQKSHWKPIPCEGTLKVEEVHLRWPTELTVNPLDNSLYIIDDHMILKLTEDNRIRIIAGRPLHCTAPAGGYEMDLATHATLISPQSMTFASNGDLYVAESDSQRINRVRLVTTDGKISHFAGAESKCNCLDQGCACFEEDYYLAATSKFNTISAICMTPDGVLHVSDQGNNRIRSIMASIPQPQSTESRPYEIYSPETQEIYVFNRFGQHVATKNIVTGETIYTFLYNVNMSNGKLSSVTDSAGNKIQILRDYSSQVKTIENSQAQKFNLKMSRVRMLQEFSTPEGYNLTFDYHGSTGLIKSRQDSSGRSSVYSYDEFGRLTMAVSPTGQVIALTFDLSQKGASVKVTRDDSLPQVVLIKGSSIYKRQGKTEEVTSVHPDGSVIRQFPWGQTITTETVPYNVLGDISPIFSDSFPIPGKQRTEVAGDLVNRVEWRYVPRKEGRGKNKQVVQIDKKMRINGENILMVEYDRDTKSEIVFSDDRNPILNVSYDRSNRPSKWSPSLGFAPVELEYDRFGRLIGWKWDDLTEVYEYDRSGRLFKIDYTDGTTLTHTFRDPIDNLPLKVTTAGGSDYLIEYDHSGAFQSLTTPRGHIHNFGISTSIGVYEYVYKAPSSRDTYKIQYNDLGQILAITYPQGSGRVNYVYNKYNKVEAIVAGLRSARFSYQENTGLLKVADVSQSSFEVKIEYKYHGGIVKEQREKYGDKTGLDNIHLKYQYDGNARVSSIEVEINGKHVQGLSIRKSQNQGILETVQDLTIYQNINSDNFNRTLIQDTPKIFQKIIEKDKVARVRRMAISLKGTEVFKLDIDYDSRGKMKHRKMMISKSAYADNVVYDADGHVSEVLGSGNWKYVYDENGNTIQIMEQGEKSSLIYDSGDRVIQVGELFRYTYDPRGFLVQRGNEKFQYDDKGLLLHAVKKDIYKVWFFYDHMDRLVSWKDDQGNVTQFLYANPETPHLITHIHFPFWGKQYLLLYDNSDALVGLTSSDGQRYYVATDQNNSPLAVFNGQGNVVKEIHRTPFGKVVRDTNPEFYLPLGFHGGVVDRKTGLVIVHGRSYDPTIGQWMVPNWKTLSATLKAPTDIFSYRFAKNDPITPRNEFADSKMTSLKDWLKLYGYDLNKIFGQDYITPLTVEPTISNNPHLVPEFGAVAGLDCIAKTVTTGFKTPGFRRGSRLKTERLLVGVNEWDLMSKIAYKRAAFGPGLLISRVESGKTLISTVDNSVIQGVITSVLNGSLSIDFKSSHQNTFYFVKDNPHKLRDDMEELKRLGGLYNISVHDAENGIKELRLSNGDTSVAVRYGTDRDEEFGRLIKHAHRRAIEKAWEEEKMYISMGLDGRRAWTEEEKEQLLSKGQVHGYRPSDLYNVHKFPQLADDPSNVVFQRDSRRKRRKSNKRHHEHSIASSFVNSLSTSSSL